MKLEDALLLKIPDDFGTNEGYEVTDVIQEIFNQLDPLTTTSWGASQFVILNKEWNEVIKIPFDGMYELDDDDEEFFDEWYIDYCKMSVDIYQKAKQKGIADIFAETRLLGVTTNGKKVYTQEKVEIPCVYSKNIKTKDNEDNFNIVEKKRKTDYAWNRFEKEWLAKAIDYYGLKFVEKFISFCKENEITDTHRDNYGYREDDIPVIFDYASFEG